MFKNENLIKMNKCVTIPDSTKVVGVGKIILNSYVTLEDNILFDLGISGNGTIFIDSRSKLKYGSVLRCYEGVISIGKHTTIGEYCIINGHGNVSIGDSVIIASHSVFLSSKHIHEGKIPIRYQGETATGIIIGSGCWIGTHVTVLDGTEIGNNSIIGACSLVNSSIPNDCIAYGVPCSIKKYRINDIRYEVTQ